MKEKVKIETATNTGRKTKDGNPVIEIKTVDGRVGSSFDIKILEFINKEVELEIKEGKEYNGVKQFYFLFPKEGQQQNGGQFPKKDWSFEKKKTALMAASTSMEDADGVVKRANVYLNFLNS